MRTLLAASLLLLLTGCGGPALDASSEESYKASLAKVNAELEPEKQAQLQTALATLAFKGMMSAPNEADQALVGFRKSVDGKTADEIIQMAAAKP